MKLYWVLLVVAIILGIAQGKEVYASALRNAGMLPLLQVVTSVEDNSEAAEWAAGLLLHAGAVRTSGATIVKPRGAEIEEWLGNYQSRAANAAANRITIESLQGAWQLDTLEGDAEPQMQALAQEHWVEAELFLAHRYQLRGDELRLQHVLVSLQKRQPQQENVVPTEWQGWRLEGYDQRSLSATCHADEYIVLYWRSSGLEDRAGIFVAHPEQGLYRVGNRLFQTLRAPNLLANGGFECLQFDELTPKPSGYQLMFQNEDLGAEAYHVAEHSGASHDHYLHVTNTFGSTILFQEPGGAQAGSMYLLLGQLRGSGQGFLGARELLGYANLFTLLAQDVTTADWQSYAGIFAPGTEATGIYVYLGVLEGSAAWTDFDNLGLYAITPPQTAPPPS
jgi:hypothetical protein